MGTTAKVTTLVTNTNTLYRTVVANAQKIGNKYFASIPRELLAVDTDYQRIDTRNKKKINSLVRNWEDRKMDALKVVAHEDEGMFYIVDGWGRFMASNMLDTPKTELECQIDFDAPTDIRARKLMEARLFAEQTQDLETVKPIQKHKANLLLGDRTATILENACNEYGVLIVANTGQRGVRTLGSYSDCYKLARSIGEDNVKLLFETIARLGWHEEKNGYSRCVMTGLGKAIAGAGDKAEAQRRIVDMLRETTPERLRANAVTRYPQRHDTTASVLYVEDIVNGVI